MTAIHDVAPRPHTPSRAFTWGWRAAMLACLALFAGPAVADGMPADALLQWRVLAVGVCAAVAGGSAVLFWAWAAQPRLGTKETSGLTRGTTAEQRRMMRQALRRRGTPLPASLHPWARAQAAAAEAVTGPGLGMLVLMSARGLQAAVDEAFPDWLALGLVAFALLWFPPMIAFARYQRRAADALTE